MPRYVNAPTHRNGTPARVGVLLVNTGTPAAATVPAVRRFLAEMLADPRLVELPRALWLPVLHGFVLRVRPRRSAHAYRRIWTAEGSPQLVYLRRLARELCRMLADRFGRETGVEAGMCYGQPSIPAALAALLARGAQRLVVLPLFPQYAGVTTGSAFDRVTAELRRWRCVPEVRFINEYHAEPGYLEALRLSVLEHWKHTGRGAHLLMSFHGMPVRCVQNGDPYHSQCHRTARLLAQALELEEGAWSIGFQSRFGRQEWLQPYSVELVRRYAAEGMRRLDVICPGFAVDCLETLEEIAIQAHATFVAHGGEALTYVPALNDLQQHVRFLAQLIEQHAGGSTDASRPWLTPGAARASA